MVDGPRLEIIYFEMSSTQRLTTLTAPLNKRHRCNIDKLVAKPTNIYLTAPNAVGMVSLQMHHIHWRQNSIKHTHTHWATEFVFKQDFFYFPAS